MDVVGHPDLVCHISKYSIGPRLNYCYEITLKKVFSKWNGSKWNGGLGLTANKTLLSRMKPQKKPVLLQGNQPWWPQQR